MEYSEGAAKCLGGFRSVVTGAQGVAFWRPSSIGGVGNSVNNFSGALDHLHITLSQRQKIGIEERWAWKHIQSASLEEDSYLLRRLFLCC